jgi:hypothetical protein
MTGILVRGRSGDWREPASTAFRDENQLKRLINNSPRLITGEPMATVVEFPIPKVGRVDVVGVDASGGITIVECKLAANPEIRREVAGQVLAYAGGLWEMRYEDFSVTWKSRSAMELVEHVREMTNTDVDAEELRSAVTENLRHGVFTLVVAVDRITDELKRIVEYLNGHTVDNVRVQALELVHAIDGEMSILVPQRYGDIEAKRPRPPASATKWTEEGFVAAIEAIEDQAEREAVQRLMEYGKEQGRPYWGTGQAPGMSWYFPFGSVSIALFQIYLRPDGAVVSAAIGAVLTAKSGGQDQALRYRDELRKIPSVAPLLTQVTDNSLYKYPSISLRKVLPGTAGADQFLDVITLVRGLADG